ncbi:pteridine reductase [Thioflexithrix psekupsensis]|uniref:Pteridine reductase n=1 Tax=Thioflexithrix psekupsensis TaxID=1570016 RepID=A0A251X3C8_9GAMM|nr:pteridine reductase [Thioflexithrix psekupsensis]OUD11672.1 pteridine reductase [Thioflexithrix psekupsensis]
MQNQPVNDPIERDRPVVFISGGVKRVGAAIARRLHAAGMNLVLHYRSAETEARDLQNELHHQRPHSVLLLQADLSHIAKLNSMIQQSMDHYGRLDVLINNASSFYPTPLGQITEDQWDDLLGSNLKAPLFLSQATAPHLTAQQGCIINLIDIHAERPLKQHAVYCAAKAGLAMLTKALARDLGPHVRVNGIAPGAILWPENDMDDLTKQRILSNIALKRHGDPDDLAKTALFLIRDAPYITGQIIAVDGGRTLSQ